MSDPRDLLRSYLRQRAELGDGDLVLDRHTASEVRDLLSPAPSRPARPMDAPAQTRPAPRADVPAPVQTRPAADAPAARREPAP
ncbi:MAG TPA: hypothetical protein VGB15_15900, partial [Longimicrobium sp.]